MILTKIVVILTCGKILILLLHGLRRELAADMMLLKSKGFWIIVIVGFVVRVLALGIPHVHPWDYPLFWHWARLLYRDGFSTFYLNEAHTDYMPGYMYVLWLKGFLDSLLDLTPAGAIYPPVSFVPRFVLIFPSVVADIAAGVLLFKWAGGLDRAKENVALFLALAYVLNPAVIMVSSVWGQVDSIYALIILLAVYLLTKKRFFPAFIIYAVGIMVKQQSIVFGPIFLFFLWDFLKTNGFSGKAFLTIFRNGIICILAIVIIVLPFAFTAEGFTFMPVARQFIDTLGQRQFATVNAYNIWGAMGLNWYPLDSPAGYGLYFFNPSVLPLRVIGYGIGIGGAAVIGFLLMVKSKVAWSYFFAGAVINIMFFMVSVRMHERYAFVAMVLLLAAYIFSGETGVVRRKEKRDVKLLCLYIAFSVGSFVNYAVVFYDSLNRWMHHYLIRNAMVYSWLMIVPFIFMMYLVVRMLIDRERGR